MMSIPECPPLQLATDRRWVKYLPSGTPVVLYGISAVASRPPAQPIYSSPSVSESRFISISPWSMPGLRALAPVMPVSSSMVTSTSRGPCLSSPDSSTERAIETPTPLSAPSVVPQAFTHSPSTRVSIGSFSKSCSTSEFFCGTMSICPWRITPLRFSMPGVAGFLIIILPISSLMVSSPSDFPKL